MLLITPASLTSSLLHILSVTFYSVSTITSTALDPVRVYQSLNQDEKRHNEEIAPTGECNNLDIDSFFAGC